MTTSTRIERSLPSILGELAAGPTPDYIDDVLVQTARKRQRPAWTFPERWLPMTETVSRSAFVPRLPWRTIGVALVIIALLVGAAVVYVGTHQTRLPEPFGPAANGLIPYGSGGDIYLGDPTTGTSRLLVGGPENDRLVGYSPDGTRLAFFRGTDAAAATPDGDLYVVREDGSDLRRVSAEPIHDPWIAWTPGGQLAVIHPVEAATAGSSTSAYTTNQLDLLDVDGGAVTTIATATALDFVQFRPPEGGEILYRALVDGKWGLFVMDPDGSNVRTLAQPTVPGEMDLSFGAATYSADGTRIFYQHGDAGGCCQLWVMNADGTDAHEFLPLGPAWDGEAVPSPDGQWIAYWHNANDGPAHGIAVVRADGTGPLIETGPKRLVGAHWVWSPDSTKILTFPSDTETASAWLLDPAGGPWTTVPWLSEGDLGWQRLAPPD